MGVSMNLSLAKSFAALAIVSAIAACGSDSTGPSSPLVGSYTAFQFVTTGGAGQTKQLTARSTVQLTLNADGSTSRQKHLPANNRNPPADIELACSLQPTL